MQDEAQIAADLRKNIPQETPAVETPPTEEPTTVDTTAHNQVYLDDPVLNQQLSDHFALNRVDKYTDHVQLQLRTIINWAAQESGSNDMNDILLTVGRLERELGIDWKQDKMKHIYNFIQLQKQTREMQKQLEWMHYE